MDKKRGNDHGFVFTRVRVASKTPLSDTNENKPKAELTGTKRQASSEASPRLDFPERKRRVAEAPTAEEEKEELSVPVKKAAQPTPLISRTRTRAIIAASTPSSKAPSSRRRATTATVAESPSVLRARPAGRSARKSTLGGRRRSTFSMRGKRASSIGGGFKATPHESVAAGDFYRHISPELPEPIRLRQLLAWCARRTAADVGPGGWPGELPPGVRRVLDEALREAVDDLHAAFEKGAIATSWYHRPVDQSEPRDASPAPAPHPENVANADALARLAARVDALRAEDAAWVRELKRAGAEHARALARLPTSVQALPAGSPLIHALPAGSPLIHAIAAPSDRCDDALRGLSEQSEAIDIQLADAERHIECVVSDLEIALDAFHLDAHRAAQNHAHAADVCSRVATDLGFAFTQRRECAQVIAATARLPPAESAEDEKKTKEEEKDSTRDLLRTLAATLNNN
ncbi:hypothetical protein GGI20_005249 [Coemansia sp. BCRC 34301]|nr:hypothetical protein GGI20_005249 [Coemansia sp. BCRC 34301]